MQFNQSKWLVAASVGFALSVAVHAQVRTIPKEGLPGLSKEATEFEIEHNYRRENGLGATVPAEEGTKPNSKDPHDFEGTWVQGRNYSVNADGSFSEASDGPGGMGAGAAGMGAGAAPGGAPGGAPPGGAGAPPSGGAPGGAPGAGGPPGGGAAGPAQNSCNMSLSFSMSMPSQIIQTDKVMYIFNNSQNGGAAYRRIEMNATLPAKLEPAILGHSVGHWDGDTLVVETAGIKASGGGGGGPGGPGLSLSANSKVTERIKKIEGGLKLEDIVSVEDTATKQVTKQRIVSYYRPDLQYVEAPCEEYSDPFADVYSDPKASAAAVSKITEGASKK